MKTVKNGAFQNGPYHFSADGQKRYPLWISPSIVSMISFQLGKIL